MRQPITECELDRLKELTFGLQRLIDLFKDQVHHPGESLNPARRFIVINPVLGVCWKNSIHQMPDHHMQRRQDSNSGGSSTENSAWDFLVIYSNYETLALEGDIRE